MFLSGLRLALVWVSGVFLSHSRLRSLKLESAASAAGFPVGVIEHSPLKPFRRWLPRPEKNALGTDAEVPAEKLNGLIDPGSRRKG